MQRNYHAKFTQLKTKIPNRIDLPSFLLSGHTNRVYSLQFDGVHVVSGSLDTSIRVWDVETGACRHALMVSARQAKYNYLSM